jgi:hypothetical protein
MKNGIKKGLWPSPTKYYWLFRFEFGVPRAEIDRLIWMHNSDVPVAGESFTRDAFDGSAALVHAEL